MKEQDAAPSLLARLAERGGLLSPAQIAACQQTSEERRANGEEVDLAQVAHEQGLLSEAQAKALRTSTRRRTALWCEPCKRPFSVLGLPPGKTLPCPKCKQPLVPRPDQQQTTLIKDGPQKRANSEAPTLLPDNTNIAVGDALIGVTLSGRYKLEAKIGQGGMGAVYRAHQVKLERSCAVKILPYELASNEQLVARLRQEARATAQLDAINIVTIYDVDRDPALGLEYLAMELLKGTPLDELLDEGVTPWREAVGLVRQAAIGLATAHAKGIIHRDVKPANLMKTHGGTVKVMDFGLARLAAGASHLSRTGQLLGTPHFMSPEQARGEELDGRTDVYSLGVTLYLLATGKTPFKANNPAAVLLKVLEERPKPAHEANPDVPRPLAAVISRMMAKDAERRYATMDEVVAELDKLLAGEKVGASLSTLRLDSMTPETRRGAAFAIGAIVLMCLGLVIGSFFSGGGEGSTGSDVAENPAYEDAFRELSRAMLGGKLDDREQERRCRVFLAEHGASPYAPDVRKWLANASKRAGEGSGTRDRSDELLARLDVFEGNGDDAGYAKLARSFIAEYASHADIDTVKKQLARVDERMAKLIELRKAAASSRSTQRDKLRGELLRLGVSKQRIAEAIAEGLGSRVEKPDAKAAGAELAAALAGGELDRGLKILAKLDGKVRNKLRDVEAELRLALAVRAIDHGDAAEAEKHLDAYDALRSKRNKKQARALREKVRDLTLSDIGSGSSDKTQISVGRRDLRARMRPLLADGDLAGAKRALAAAAKGEYAHRMQDDLKGFEVHLQRLAKLPEMVRTALERVRQAKRPANAVWSTYSPQSRITAIDGDVIEIALQHGATTKQRISKMKPAELLRLVDAAPGTIDPLSLATRFAYQGAVDEAEAILRRLAMGGVKPDDLLLETVAPPPYLLDLSKAWSTHDGQLTSAPRSKLAGVPWSAKLERGDVIATTQGQWEPTSGGLAKGHGLALMRYKDIRNPEITSRWHWPKDSRAGATAFLALVVSRSIRMRRKGEISLIFGINLRQSTMFVVRYVGPGSKPAGIALEQVKGLDLHSKSLTLRVVHFEGGLTFAVMDGKGEPRSIKVDRRTLGRNGATAAAIFRMPAKVGVLASNVRAELRSVTLKAGR